MEIILETHQTFYIRYLHFIRGSQERILHKIEFSDVTSMLSVKYTCTCITNASS